MAFDGSTLLVASTATFTGFVFTDTFTAAGSDVDMVSVFLIAGNCYDIDVDDGNDLYLRVFDFLGHELKANDDGAAPAEIVGISPYTRFFAPYSGTYYVAVSPYYLTGYDPEVTTGRFAPENPLAAVEGTLTITDIGIEFFPDASSIGAIGPGGVSDNTDLLSDADGRNRVEYMDPTIISPGTDVEIGRFDLSKGDVVVVEVDGDTGNPDVLDGVIRVFNATGMQIGFDDNSGGLLDPELVFAAPSDGTYYIAVSGAGNSTYNPLDGTGTLVGDTGSFTVVLHLNPTQIGSVLSQSITGKSGDDHIVSLSGNDTISGGEGADTLAGGDDSDSLNGGAGNDYLYGDGGNDVVDGGTGADVMSGGRGNDVFFIDDANDVVVERADAGFDIAYTGLSFIQWSDVDQVIATGAAAVTGFGNNGANLMDATARFAGVLFDGVGGNDVLYGSNYADTLFGGGSNDILFGFLSVGGVDSMVGGTGDDVYYVYEADDILLESISEGLDTVYAFANITLTSHLEQVILVGSGTVVTGNSQNNNIFGNNLVAALTLDGVAGDDWLIGGAGGDTLRGGADNDQLQGLGGSNRLEGGTGDDQFFSTSLTDIIIENASEGFDTLYANYNVNLLAANVEQLSVSGGATIANGNGLANVIYANNNSVATSIDAGAGADIVYGSGNGDTIFGGLGNDTMQGAGGADRFAYAAGNMGADRITDFTDAVDLIGLNGLGYTSGSIGTAITLSGGANALVTFATGSLAGTTITLIGVNQANITAGDFLY